MNACLSRSAENLSDVVGRLSPATNPLWKKRDITGDGKPETFCNQFLEAALELLEAPVPPGLLARQQIDWLDSGAGREAGWREMSRGLALAAAKAGQPVVVGWRNTDFKSSSHVALAIPTPFGEEFQIAQAGRENFNAGALRRGFGVYPVRFWVHE